MNPLEPVHTEAPPPEDAVTAAGEPETEHAVAAVPQDDGAALPVLEGRFVSVDKTGSITTWTARAEETFYFSRPEVAGQPLAKVVAPESQERVREELEAVLAGGPARQLEVEAVDGHGREFPAALSLVPIGIAAGYAFNSLLQDLTRQAITREALARLRREHAAVLESIRTSLEPTAGGDAADERVVGALVMFEDRGPRRGEPADDDGLDPVAAPAGDVAQLADIKADAEHARRDARDAEARAREAEAEARALREEARELRAQVKEARTEVDEKDRELAEATEGARAASAEAKQREERLAETASATEAVESELAAARDRANELDVDLREARDRADELEGELAAARGRSDEVESGLAAARARVEELEAELGAVRGRADEAEGELAAAQARMEELDGDLVAARGHAEELDGELVAARARADELERELAAAKDGAGELERELAAEKESNEALAAEVGAEKQRGEELATELAAATERAEAREAELAEASSKLEEARALVDERDRRLKDLDGGSAEMSAELDRARAELAETRESAQSAHSTAEELEARLAEVAEESRARDEDFEAARSTLEATRSELEAARAELDAIRAAGDERAGGLESELETARREAAEAAKRADELAAELERARTEAAEAGGRAGETDDALEAARREAEELRARVEEAERRAEEAGAEIEAARQEAEEREEATLEAVDRDPVTGLLNRRAFEEELSRKIAEAAHHGGGGAAVLLNLEDFDSLKADLPEEAGEELLRSVASALREHLCNTDLLARLSGDEFAVLLPDADADKAQTIAEELVRAIGPQVVKVGDKSIRITLSVGVALFDERDHHVGPVPAAAVPATTEVTNLPVPVDGRSSLAPVDGAPVPAERVQQALEGDHFHLYCQPVVDMRTGDVAQYELLLRMADDDGNLILPRAFLRTAEESGLIRSIDQWVVRRAIHLIAEAGRAGKQLRLEVNIAGGSVDDPDLAAVIEQELITTGADPGSLVLEVPESVATARHDEVKDLAKRVRALGCRFAVDNFGSAVTSFRYIKDLPLDFLKLDGDLIATLPESRTDQLVVKAIVDIARGMGCETIAEMVADDETLFLLRQQGLGYAQGYQVGRPRPVSEL